MRLTHTFADTAETRDYIVLVCSAGLAGSQLLLREDARLCQERLLAYGGAGTSFTAATGSGQTRALEEFTAAHCLRLTMRLVERALSLAAASSAFTEAPGGPRALEAAVKSRFPLHDNNFNAKFMSTYVSNVISLELFDSGGAAISELRAHFGERIAFYFAFLAYYSSALIPFTAFTLLYYLIVRFIDWSAYCRGLSLVGMSACTVFAPLVVKGWERRQTRLAFKWNVLGTIEDEAPNMCVPKDTEAHDAAMRAAEANYEALYKELAVRDSLRESLSHSKRVVARKKDAMFEMMLPTLQDGVHNSAMDIPRTAGERKRAAHALALTTDADRSRLRVAIFMVPFAAFNLLLLIGGTLPFLQWYVFGKLVPTCDCCTWFQGLQAANPNADALLLLLNATSVPSACTMYQTGATTLGFVAPKTCTYFWSCFTSTSSHVGSDRWLYILVQGIILGIVLDVCQFEFFSWVTTEFTIAERWSSELRFEKELIHKQYVFMWVNLYFWFFFVAFVYVPFGPQVQVRRARCAARPRSRMPMFALWIFCKVLSPSPAAAPVVPPPPPILATCCRMILTSPSPCAPRTSSSTSAWA